MSLLITFEGPEGSGKSTQAERLASRLRKRKLRVLLTREPGGTPLGDALRDLLLNPHPEEAMGDRAELLLYLAARAQHVEARIRPALREGAVVIADRFTDASVAYQGYGRELGEERVRSLNDFATDGLKPDLTFILDVPPDRLEQETLAFHRRVREGYRSLAETEPGRCVLLDATSSIEDVASAVWEHVAPRLNRPDP